MTRILTALVGLPILFAVIKYLPPMVFLLVVLGAVLLGCHELFAMARKRDVEAHRTLGSVLAVALAYTFFDTQLDALDILGAAAILIPLASLWRAARRGGRLDGEFAAIAVTLLGVIFVGLLMGYSLALLHDGGERGRDLTVLLFWVVWLSDAGAYAIGSIWGRHKLIPLISPGKTVEGAVGALAIAVAAALAARGWFFTALTAGDAIALGLLLGAFGMVGDLSESLMKRAAGIKDSGWLLPGHGGILDRTDSLLFAAPVLFYYHRYFLQ